MQPWRPGVLAFSVSGGTTPGTAPGTGHRARDVSLRSHAPTTWQGACTQGPAMIRALIVFATLSALLLLATPAVASVEPPALCDETRDGCELAKPWRDWIAAPPSRQRLFAYAIKCALPGEASISVPGADTLKGGWGLRPDWQRGVLDADGQELVSSCILAHINASGEHVTIAIAGPDMTFTPPPSFRHMEGAFFGNLFAGTKKNVCKGPGD